MLDVEKIREKLIVLNESDAESIVMITAAHLALVNGEMVNIRVINM